MRFVDSSVIDLEGLKIINDPELRGTLERLGHVVMQRTPEETKQTLELERKTAQVIQLPLWPEPVRGAPNSFLRSEKWFSSCNRTSVGNVKSNLVL